MIKKFIIPLTLLILISSSIIWLYLFSLSNNEVDINENNLVKKEATDFSISNSEKKLQVDSKRISVDSIHLGIYEFVYEYNTEDLKENHYIELYSDKAFYYGTSDDFDIAREGYYPGFYKIKLNDLEINNNEIQFSINPDDLIFYDNPILPNEEIKENGIWDISVSKDIRFYRGKIKNETIELKSKDLEKRKYIRLK